MVVAICDDERDWCCEAEQILEDYVARSKLKFEIICFKDAASLLNYSGKTIDVLFLDIEMPHMS